MKINKKVPRDVGNQGAEQVRKVPPATEQIYNIMNYIMNYVMLYTDIVFFYKYAKYLPQP